MTECSSVRTTKTMIIQYIIVDQNGAAGGGIAHVTGQILTGITGTQNMAKGSDKLEFLERFLLFNERSQNDGSKPFKLRAV